MLSNEEFKLGIFKKTEELKKKRRRKIKMAVSLTLPCICITAAMSVLMLNRADLKAGKAECLNQSDEISNACSDQFSFADNSDQAEKEVATDSKPEAPATDEEYNQTVAAEEIFFIKLTGKISKKPFDISLIKNKAELKNALCGAAPDDEIISALKERLKENYIIIIALPQKSNFIPKQIKSDEKHITIKLERSKAEVAKGMAAEYLITSVPKKSYSGQKINIEV